MIYQSADFEEATAFELFALSELCPVIEQSQGASLDLRGGKTIAAVRITISENMSQGAIDATRDKLAPLLFGAAWKILDLAIELSLNTSGARPKQSNWTIAEKTLLAQSAACSSAALGCSSAVWSALLRLYSATVEHRHCLVHRTADVDASTGALEGLDRNRNRLLPLTRQQLLAISKAMSLVCRGIISPPIQSRSEDHLRFFLDQLTSHTRVAPFGVGGPDGPVTLEVSAESSGGIIRLDIGAALARARSVFAMVAHFDLIAHLDDGRELHCRAEDVPPGENQLDIEALPLWVKLVSRQ